MQIDRAGGGGERRASRAGRLASPWGSFAAALVTAMLTGRPALAEDVRIPSAGIKPASPAQDGSGRFLLLTVGVGKFADDFWPALRWTTADARLVAADFGEATGLTVVRRSLTDAQATRQELLKVLQEMRATATPRDTVVVYLSTHGTLAETDDGELEKVTVLHDTRQDAALTTGITQRELSDWLERVPARRRLLIYATCHGGVGKSRLPPRVERLMSSAKGQLAPLEEVSDGTLILAAAARGEAAREDDGLQGDIYTHYLIEGLKAGDRNRDGMVTALEAHDYAKERTYAHTKGRQRPTAEARFIGEADVPLQGKRERRGTPVLEAYDEDLAGFQLQVDDGVKGRLPLALPLKESGASRVTLYGRGEGRRLAEYRVNAAPGETVALADVLAPPPLVLSVDLGQERFDDERIKLLTGKDRFTSAALRLAYHPRAFASWYGGLAAFGANVTDRSLRTGLQAELARQRVQIDIGHVFQPLPFWRLWVGGLAASERMELQLSDTLGEVLTYSSQAWLGGADFGVERELRLGLGLALTASVLSGQHRFDELGDVDTLRSAFGLRFLLRFGGVARRL